MKKNIILLYLLISSLSVMAIPVKKGVNKTIVLEDGTTVVATLHGDEYGHWWQSEDGKRYQVEDERTVKLSETAFTQLREKSIERRNARNLARNQRMARVRKNSGNTNFTGDKKGLVILVNFSDKSMKSASTQEEFDNMFNQEGYSNNNHIGSLHDYFLDQSYGEFNLEFDVVGPVIVSKTMSYYGKNTNGNDSHPAEMVIEACRLVDENYDINFADYDWDGDGVVDQVYLIYAGYGENAGASSSTIWPHEWQLSSANYYGDGEGAVTIDDVEIDTYAVSCELAGASGSTMNGIGTACHEFSHCLGYPDFYDIDYSGGWGMSGWDVMCSGSYSGPFYNGEVPCGYTSYERWVAGWIEPKELNPGMEVEALQPLGDTPDAYVMYNEGNHNEYYLFENRTSDRWFKYVNTYTDISGLLIIHVDYDEDVWAYNGPNDVKSHQRMTIIPASNLFPSSPRKSDFQAQLYPSSKNNSLTNTTTPKASLYNKNTDGQKLMNKPIYFITKNDDQTISFRCGDIMATAVSINETSLDMIVGDKVQLTATVTEPENATNSTFSWTSSNTSCATVSGTGLVTAKGEGTSTITATTTDGSALSVSCEVTVTAIKVESVEINFESYELHVGETKTLSATVTPTNATNKKLLWTSSNPQVASVNSSGKVTAKSVGETVITATTTDGTEISASCEITVLPYLVEEITISQTTAEMEVGDELDIKAVVSPTKATNKELAWSSSDESVVSVDNGHVVALAGGEAVVTVSATDGSDVSASCAIVVAMPSGIMSVIANDSVEGIYTLGGKKVEHMHQGVYLVRMKDGSVSKVVVK